MITYLNLINFKCFDDLEINLAPLTLITGINSMGKSTVIQSMLLLRQSFDERYLPTEGEALLTGNLVNLINGEALRYTLAKEPNTSIDIEFENEIKGTWKIVSQGKGPLLNCKYSGNESIYSQNIFDDNFVYIAAERIGPRTQYSKTKITKHKGRLGVGYSDLTASYLYKCLSNNLKLPIAALKHPKAENDFIYDNTSAWLSEILYEGTQLTATEATPDTIELKYSFNKGKFAQEFSPVNVAFGFSYILPVILSILSAPAGSLILMENPEAHLHPAAQSKVGKLLAIASQHNIQIIAETHSDHLLNGIRVSIKDKSKNISAEKILIHYFDSELNKEGEDKHFRTTIKIDQEGMFDSFPKNFFDEWDNNLIKLI